METIWHSAVTEMQIKTHCHVGKGSVGQVTTSAFSRSGCCLVPLLPRPGPGVVA